MRYTYINKTKEENTMRNRRLRRALILLALVCVTLSVGVALADAEDALEMKTYWSIVGSANQNEPLARAMNGDYAALTLDELKAITKDDLLAFAAAYKLPVSMARHAWYTAMADRLTHELPATATGEQLVLFLAMQTNSRDKAANEERRSIRKALTEADIHAYAAETGLPAGFLCWLMLDDEWHEPEWDDGDDWQDGRRGWNIPDWADASDLREKYGKEAVVTDDDVERILRQHGYHFDD